MSEFRAQNQVHGRTDVDGSTRSPFIESEDAAVFTFWFWEKSCLPHDEEVLQIPRRGRYPARLEKGPAGAVERTGEADL